MKKFLFKLCVFILISSAIILSMNYLYAPIATNGYGTDKFRDMPEHIQICNFGSSHGFFGFNYGEANDKCFNFALESQSLLYDYRILQCYADRINEGGIIFIVVSYFSFFGGSEAEASDLTSMNNRYYKILPANLIKNYDLITDVIINYVPVLAFNISTILNVFRGITTEDRKIKTAEKLDNIAEVGKKRAAYHFNSIRQKGNGSIRYNHERTEALYNIINLCKEKKLIPILVTTPFLTEYSSQFKRDSEFMNAFHSIINEVIASTGVRYYDYSEDERFSHDYSLFMDTDHLNKNGALKFTNTLISDVLHDLE